jgi:feruloyl-CoA synthase
VNSTMPKPAAEAGKPPFRPIRFAQPNVIREDRADGSIILRAAQPLAAYEPSLARLFRSAVERHPDRLLMAERDATSAWAGVTYAQARRKADAVAQALIDRGLSAERPVMVLSGNAVEHGLMTLACYTAGIPVSPISVAYSLQSHDHAKLKYINELLTPGLVYVSDTAPFAKALAHVSAPIVAGKNGANLPNVTLFSELEKAQPGAAVEQAVAAITPDTIAKFLFTSGSTSLPKGVINTHGMLTANQQQSVQTWPFIEDDPMVLVDWLPWNHTFGSNYNFNLILQQAGTLYIDGGKPLPALVGQTVQNLREIAPTIYFNVPAGYGALLPFLEKDDSLARHFFSRVRLLFYAGASLPQDMWDRLEALAIRITGMRVPMTSAWGTTETSPLATSAHALLERAGNVGVPVPGVDVKLVPAGSKLEVRVRGPNITPGYWRRPDLTASMFDEDGYYLPGDAVRFADPDDPDRGLIFDGRTAEDFKLTNGTWVAVGALRVGAIAAASPVLQDAIVCGEGRDQVGLVAWLNAAGCKQITGEDGDLAFYAAHPKVQTHLRDAFGRWNKVNTGATMRVARVLLLPDMPSIDRNEITDKGYINQRVALECRKAEGQRLFDGNPHPDVVVIV